MMSAIPSSSDRISLSSTDTVTSGSDCPRRSSIFIGLSLLALSSTGMPADLRLLDDEQRALVQMVREFCAAEAAPAAATYEERAEDPLALYGKLTELGLTGIPFPEEFGGGGQPYSTYLLVIEEIAYSYLALAIGLSVHTLCAFAVNTFGTDAQRKEVLAKLRTGEWYGAYSLSEPASGSDAGSLRARAQHVDGGYKITGSKVFCTRGAEADVVLLMARTGDEGSKGVTAFLVETGTQGFSPGKKENKMGWRSSPTWALNLDDPTTPDPGRLGEGELVLKIPPPSPFSE